MKRVIAAVIIALLLFSCKSEQTTESPICGDSVRKVVMVRNIVGFESLAKNDPFYFHLFSLIDMQSIPPRERKIVEQ